MLMRAAHLPKKRDDRFGLVSSFFFCCLFVTQKTPATCATRVELYELCVLYNTDTLISVKESVNKVYRFVLLPVDNLCIHLRHAHIGMPKQFAYSV